MNEFVSVYASFAKSAQRWTDRPFIHIPEVACRSYSKSSIDWTYGEAAATVRDLAALYRSSPLQRGHRVALMLGNRPDFFAHYFALNALGASVVPLNPESSVEEILHVLIDSGSVCVRSLPEHRDLLERVISRLAAPVDARYEDGVPFNEESYRRPPSASADEAALLYTSGSTGAPKGCMLSNDYMLAMGGWYCRIGDLCSMQAGRERLLTPLPLVHMNALAVSTMATVLSGGCIVQLDRFHPKSWWETVRACEATIIHYLGVMPAILLQMPPSSDDSRHNVKFGFGAGVHPKHHRAFEERFGFPLIESWSMTEVGGGGAIIAADEPRYVGARCFGRPSDAVHVRIVDELGNQVANAESGELLVRAAAANSRAGFFTGYNNQPGLTETAWEGGYFHTGDVVRRGPDGSLYFVDRKKSIIRRSGENIASLEVEAVLNQLHEVRAVGVGPVDDEIRGEEVMGCIQLHPGVEWSESTAMRIFCASAERLAYFKLPGYIAFVRELPVTASQKLQRGQLKALSHALIAQGQAYDLRHHKKRPGHG